MASIKKAPTGKWRLRYRDPSGAPKMESFDRKVDAEARRDALGVAMRRGEYVDPAAGRQTVRAYSEQWQATRVHRESSAERLEVYLRRHILPHLGDRKIGQIRPSDVQAWVKQLEATLAPGTVENVYRAFSGMMRSAVRDRVITSSPCVEIELPERDGAEVIPPTVDEVDALLDAMPDRYRILAVLAAGAGLRLGEALGLTVDRVDFLRRQVRVDRQLVTISGKAPRFGPVKGKRGNRTTTRIVPLADAVLDALSAHLAAYPATPGVLLDDRGEEVQHGGLICTLEDGSPIRRNAFGHMWRRGPQKAAAFRYHDLRHHFASLLIAAGCSIKVVQQALGHASAKVTLDTYAHLWPESDDLTRAAVQSALGASVQRACNGLGSVSGDNALTRDFAATRGPRASSAATIEAPAPTCD